MKKLFFCCLCLLLAQPVCAEQESNSSIVEVSQTAEVSSSENTSAVQDVSETFATIVRTVEKDIKPLPQCNDEKLLAEARDFVTKYYQKNENMGVMFRRHRHFVLKALQSEFEQENVANYRTQETRPISDIIAELKVNQGVAEENIILCKKQISIKGMKDIYLLVYPVEEGYKVHVLNLNPKREKTPDSSFIYKK